MNRLTETLNGDTPVSDSYDDADRLVSMGGVSYTYDGSGNLVARGSETTPGTTPASWPARP